MNFFLGHVNYMVWPVQVSSHVPLYALINQDWGTFLPLPAMRSEQWLFNGSCIFVRWPKNNARWSANRIKHIKFKAHAEGKENREFSNTFPPSCLSMAAFNILLIIIVVGAFLLLLLSMIILAATILLLIIICGFNRSLLLPRSAFSFLRCDLRSTRIRNTPCSCVRNGVIGPFYTKFAFVTGARHTLYDSFAARRAMNGAYDCISRIKQLWGHRNKERWQDGFFVHRSTWPCGSLQPIMCRSRTQEIQSSRAFQQRQGTVAFILISIPTENSKDCEDRFFLSF